MPAEIPLSKFVTRGHTTRVIFRVKFAYLSDRKKTIILKNENTFSQKNYTTIIRTYWAKKYESWRENEFWATCHIISNLFDRC